MPFLERPHPNAQFIWSEVPALLLVVVLASWMHSRLVRREVEDCWRVFITWITSMIALIVFHKVIAGEYFIPFILVPGQRFGVLVVVTLFFPTLTAEKALHYESFQRHFPLRYQLIFVFALSLVAVSTFLLLSPMMEHSRYQGRAVLLWVIWLICLIMACCFPSRFTLPCMLAAVLNAAWKFDTSTGILRDFGFWGMWSGRGHTPGITKFVISHALPFIVVGVILEFLIPANHLQTAPRKNKPPEQS